MSLSVSVYLPALGQQDVLDECVELLVDNQQLPETTIHVIDNGSQKPITSQHAFVIRNEENRGMVGTLRQAREHTDAEIMVFQHTDMFIYEAGWDAQLAAAFEADPKLGMLGVVGAEWATKDGGRARVWCAFRDWVSHGSQPRQHITPVALLDGCYMAIRVSMLDQIDWSKLEEQGYFFGYDKDLSLTFTMEQFRVGVIDFDCEHLGGRTSCSEEFANTIHPSGETHGTMYARSEKRYMEKWATCFNVKVKKDWHVDVSQP